MRMYNPAHPGLVLKEFIEGHSVSDIAQRLGISRIALSRILNAKAPITPEIAKRLSELLNTSIDVWLGMQAAYDTWQAEHSPSFGIQPLYA